MLAKTNAPLILFEVTPERLQELWPFLRRGLELLRARALRKIDDEVVGPDWIPENIFAALAVGGVSCVIAQRRDRLLGFDVYYKQFRFWSKKPEMFVMAAWDLPLREWQEGDDMPEMFAAMWRYINNIAISNYGTRVITWGATTERAKGYMRKYGWKPMFVTYYIKAENGN